MSMTTSTNDPPPPYLTDEEIAEICKPLQLAHARTRHLKRLGLVVKSKADGSPLVGRAEFVRVMMGGQVPSTTSAVDAPAAATGPNIIGLEQWAAGRKRRGQKS